MDYENIDYSIMDEDELYECGCDFLDDEDIDNAIKCITLAAEKGSVEAQFHLAELYHYGQVVETDFEESLKWYKLAAENGDSLSQRQLAEIYLDGDGVEENLEEALKWYKLAAERGDRVAIYMLGHMYYHGDKVEQDYKEAYYWFDKDGFRDLPYYICADMYFYVDKNYPTAFRLYHNALEQGVEIAAYKIGEMYYYGLGTDQDYSKAFEFLKYYEGDVDPEDFDFDFAPPEVNRMLGEMYKNGWGVEKNTKIAECFLEATKKCEDNK